MFKMPQLWVVLFLLACIPVSAQPNLEQRAKEVPRRFTKDPDKLVTYLIHDLKDDSSKAKVIYYWIARNIAYDYARYKKGEVRKNNAKTILERRKGLCGDYAHLFRIMCAKANITALEVSGYAKGDGLYPDDVLYTTDHAWNVVQLDGQWYLADLTFASGYIGMKPSFMDKVARVLTFKSREQTKKSVRGFVRERNDQYFMADPIAFLENHLPVVPMYQLNDKVVSKEIFVLPAHEMRALIPDSGAVYDFDPRLTKYIEMSSVPQLNYEADSGFAFNCRNYLLVSKNLYLAGIHTLGHEEEDGRFQVNEDLKRADLLDADRYFAKCLKSLPQSRKMVEEEFKRRQDNNKRRQKLQEHYSKEVENGQKKLQEYLKNHDKLNKGLVQTNNKTAEKLEKTIEKLENRGFSASSNGLQGAEARKKVQESQAAIRLLKDSLLVLQQLWEQIYKQAERNDIDTLDKMSKGMDQALLHVIYSTRDLLAYRKAKYDNLDKDVYERCRLRALSNDTVINLLILRKQKMKQTKTDLATLKNISNTYGNLVADICKHMALCNALGEHYQKEMQQLDRDYIHKLEKLIALHHSYSAALEEELTWMPRFRDMEKVLKRMIPKEGTFEQARFKEMEKNIKLRKEVLAKALDSYEEQSTKMQKVLKPVLDAEKKRKKKKTA